MFHELERSLSFEISFSFKQFDVGLQTREPSETTIQLDNALSRRCGLPTSIQQRELFERKQRVLIVSISISTIRRYRLAVTHRDEVPERYVDAGFVTLYDGRIVILIQDVDGDDFRSHVLWATFLVNDTVHFELHARSGSSWRAQDVAIQGRVREQLALDGVKIVGSWKTRTNFPLLFPRYGLF